jgi:hypothetical protein
LQQFPLQRQQNFQELLENTEIRNETLCEVQMQYIVDGLRSSERWAEYGEFHRNFKRKIFPPFLKLFQFL